jgi:hypothetical protein
LKNARRFIIIAVAMLLYACTSRAQANPPVNNFTFDGSSAIVSWNGSDPANPPYPGDMGAVSLTSAFGSPGSGIEVPFQLGYLNNGFLVPCNAITWGPKVYTTGDGTNIGDKYTISGSTDCPYFTGEYGDYQNSKNRHDSWSVVAVYKVTNKQISCRYGRCTTRYTITLQGGTGTVTETTTQ